VLDFLNVTEEGPFELDLREEGGYKWLTKETPLL
jgi:hypothetical protein